MSIGSGLPCRRPRGFLLFASPCRMLKSGSWRRLKVLYGPVASRPLAPLYNPFHCGPDPGRHSNPRQRDGSCFGGGSPSDGGLGAWPSRGIRGLDLVVKPALPPIPCENEHRRDGCPWARPIRTGLSHHGSAAIGPTRDPRSQSNLAAPSQGLGTRLTRRTNPGDRAVSGGERNGEDALRPATSGATTKMEASREED